VSDGRNSSPAPVLVGADGVDRPEHDADARLMLAFQQGDERCFDQLFEKHQRAVIGFAARFTGRRDVAEELAQEIFVKCYLARSSYQPTAKFKTWLFRIARNHCLNELRRQDYRRPPQPLDEAQQPSSQLTPEAELESRALERAVEQALAALPESQRTALLLSRTQAMSYDEIAAAMGTSVSAVKSLLHRAKQTLVERLGEVAEGHHDAM
jgi:RNA polymerase sigma-70 factor (ECF subfamily)